MQHSNNHTDQYFQIFRSDHQLLFISKSYKRLPELLASAENNIKQLSYNNGIVVFDLLLTNGINNRFFELPCKEGKLVTKCLKKLSKPDKDILKCTNDFFSKNQSLISSSFISRTDKKEFINSIK
ncbi:type II toxin-antitoxin system RnlB family antitoxin [Sphingobacterium chungjuense]|uniref:type II toxin-antitoxin system RnlB family antitoxin n=1 Tax=Sphingobacterium chungjuense TaxID=2675553 RepID=UPI00140757D8|nr:type II toxin-antitoxin system RnlB family antitoxin [Sphingobacterium chungjuense]